MPSHLSPAAGAPIRGVVFDLHATLVHDGGDPAAWLAAAAALMESETAGQGPAAAGPSSPAGPGSAVGLPDVGALADWATRIWDVAREIDPASERDLSPTRHRAVYDAMIERIAVVPAPVADALYRTMLDQWQAYTESADVLDELRARGVRTAILSNIGLDPRAVLVRTGLAGRYDAEVFSFEVGVVKPDPAIFHLVTKRLGLDPREVLMVGDSVQDDGGAAHVGMRTLILPRTTGPTHGLEQVLRLVGRA
ncbi:MAG: HAD family hydrolase [Candidatus Nanopelagicales bacterium]